MDITYRSTESRPPRARGLKLLALLPMLFVDVAPPAGAWIETFNSETTQQNSDVAPPAGAWIETVVMAYGIINIMSRAPRGRVD